MPKQVQNAAPPTGIGKFFFRAPIKLYDIGLGWMLGKRFLLLNHIGRRDRPIAQREFRRNVFANGQRRGKGLLRVDDRLVGSKKVKEQMIAVKFIGF